jgi:steroid delta-isomerase-like uncharacterized protein
MATNAQQSQSNIVTVRSFIESFWNQNETDRAKDFLAPDYKDFAYMPQNVEGLCETSRQLNIAFPDQHSSIDNIIADGNQVIVRMVLRGTHEGPFRGHPATGHPIEVTVYREYQLVDGKISEHRALFDTATLYRQIGAELTAENACKLK